MKKGASSHRTLERVHSQPSESSSNQPNKIPKARRQSSLCNISIEKSVTKTSLSNSPNSKLKRKISKQFVQGKPASASNLKEATVQIKIIFCPPEGEKVSVTVRINRYTRASHIIQELKQKWHGFELANGWILSEVWERPRLRRVFHLDEFVLPVIESWPSGAIANIVMSESLYFIEKRRDFTVQNHDWLIPCQMDWLSKQGGSYKSWKRRFFVLTEGVLSYYKQDLTQTPKIKPVGQFFLENVQLYQIDDYKRSVCKYTFVLKTRAIYTDKNRQSDITDPDLIWVTETADELEIELERTSRFIATDDEHVFYRWMNHLNEAVLISNKASYIIPDGAKEICEII